MNPQVIAMCKLLRASNAQQKAISKNMHVKRAILCSHQIPPNTTNANLVGHHLPPIPPPPFRVVGLVVVIWWYRNS